MEITEEPVEVQISEDQSQNTQNVENGIEIQNSEANSQQPVQSPTIAENIPVSAELEENWSMP